MEDFTFRICARRYCFAFRAAMLSSKQLLWHFLVLALGLRQVSVQYPLTEAYAMLQTNIPAQFFSPLTLKHCLRFFWSFPDAKK